MFMENPAAMLHSWLRSAYAICISVGIEFASLYPPLGAATEALPLLA